jgi:hypothetical protein
LVNRFIEINFAIHKLIAENLPRSVASLLWEREFINFDDRFNDYDGLLFTDAAERFISWFVEPRRNLLDFWSSPITERLFIYKNIIL